jgi:acetoin:2,6-dichlorophenolindophenol oxidoreductase subunit alpha
MTEELLELHRLMCRIRAFDSKVEELFNHGRLPGLLHSCVGQEASAAGVVGQLRQDDYVLTTHRGHGHCLAKGADPGRMMAELFARETGYCRGKGGSMHVCDLERGLLGANGIVGAGLPIAAGVGTAIRLQRTSQVVVCIFGDGASNEGGFHEALNLAAVWELPVIYVCENNQYAQYTHQRLHTKVEELYRRAEGYGIPGERVDGNDLLAVHASAATAIDRARSGAGPTFIECLTYRWTGHSISNPGSAIGRPEDEIDEWKRRDPIPRVENRLLEARLATRADLASVHDEAAAEIEAAVRFAEDSPEPQPGSALEDVYAHLPEGALL